MSLVVAAATSACGQEASRPETAGQGAAGERPVTFLAGQTLLTRDGAEIPLDRPAVGGLMGWLAPVGVPSPDNEDQLLYMSWRDLREVDAQLSYSDQGIANGDPLGRPSIRLLDKATGDDHLFADGAYSVAWGAPGIAYFAGSDPDYRANERYVGEILVAPTLDASGVSWTPNAPDSYVVMGWAGTTLIAYRVNRGEYLDVLAIDAPGQIRTLARLASVVAISPDGTRIAVHDTSDGGSKAKVINVPTGVEEAELDLAAEKGQMLQYLSYGGSWQGDYIASEAAPGIAVLKYTPGALEVSRVVPVPAAQAPMGVNEVTLLDGGGRVVAWAPLPGRGNSDRGGYLYINCTVGPGKCTRSPDFDSRTFFTVYNPSRPAKETP